MGGRSHGAGSESVLRRRPPRACAEDLRHAHGRRRRSRWSLLGRTAHVRRRAGWPAGRPRPRRGEEAGDGEDQSADRQPRLPRQAGNRKRAAQAR